jgi:hypothetical protein
MEKEVRIEEKEGIEVESLSKPTQYVCEFCGIYTALKPRCNKCDKEK